jgi:aminopeptidase YwaD
LQKSFNEGKLARPARTIRFVFPPEIEGTLALLNAKPDLAKRIKAVVHMDMVGGGPETKAVFHVTRGPMSLPSFVHDVAWAFAEFVNEQSYQFAATGKADYPFISPEGGKEPLRAECSFYTMGSDHDVYQDSSFGIPAIYLNDWPDRFIHTNLDTPANIDPTKLKRVAFIGAASGYFLANLTAQTYQEISQQSSITRVNEMGEALRRASQVPPDESQNLLRLWSGQFLAKGHALDKFLSLNFPTVLTAPGMEKPQSLLALALGSEPLASGDGLLKFARNSSLKGPMEVFGSNYFEDERARRALPTKPKLLDFTGLWGSGEEYAYEVLNFADGKRNAQQIREAISAEYGPVPLEMVLEYLKALEATEIVERVK